MKSSTLRSWSPFADGRRADDTFFGHRLETATGRTVSHRSDSKLLREMEMELEVLQKWLASTPVPPNQDDSFRSHSIRLGHAGCIRQDHGRETPTEAEKQGSKAKTLPFLETRQAPSGRTAQRGRHTDGLPEPILS
ncbi:MAG: hypothetical protein KatS3mg107_0528 [Gemmataceae bacterium]|jgi:hypothetical protein|nr:MAG: hypothetical protein KatS3mg107_0528 [Gemmataceae bacterium]